jgi:hypothetical protein
MQQQLPGDRADRPLLARRADHRNGIALVAAVNSKITIDSDDAMFEVHLAQPNQAQVGKIRFSVCIAFRQSLKLRQMIVAIEGERHQLLIDELQYTRAAAKMKGRFRQDRLASK